MKQRQRQSYRQAERKPAEKVTPLLPRWLVRSALIPLTAALSVTLSLSPFSSAQQTAPPTLQESASQRGSEENESARIARLFQSTEASLQDLRSELQSYHRLRYESGIGNRIVGWTSELFGGENSRFTEISGELTQLERQLRQARASLESQQYPETERRLQVILRQRRGISQKFQDFLNSVYQGASSASIAFGAAPVVVGVGGACVLAPAVTRFAGAAAFH